jgi:hypothetical protein
VKTCRLSASACARVRDSERGDQRGRERDTDRRTDLPVLDGLVPTLKQTVQALVGLVVRQRFQLPLQAVDQVLCPCVVHLGRALMTSVGQQTAVTETFDMKQDCRLDARKKLSPDGHIEKPFRARLQACWSRPQRRPTEPSKVHRSQRQQMQPLHFARANRSCANRLCMSRNCERCGSHADLGCHRAKQNSSQLRRARPTDRRHEASAKGHSQSHT